jgi:hypothetical protein
MLLANGHTTRRVIGRLINEVKGERSDTEPIVDLVRHRAHDQDDEKKNLLTQQQPHSIHCLGKE